MREINTNDPNFFDWWRENYNTFSPEENVEIGNQLEEKYPGQASFNFENMKVLFDKGQRYENILEVGGWKGELAIKCLHEWGDQIGSWHNIDMCAAAVNKAIKHEKLMSEFPYFFTWFLKKRNIKYDLCISAHTIEHLSNEDLKGLINYISGIPVVLFEAPIANDKNNWSGYCGTHILEMGWNEINKIMTEKGYSFTKLNDWTFLYKLGNTL